MVGKPCDPQGSGSYKMGVILLSCLVGCWECFRVSSTHKYPIRTAAIVVLKRKKSNLTSSHFPLVLPVWRPHIHINAVDFILSFVVPLPYISYLIIAIIGLLTLTAIQALQCGGSSQMHKFELEVPHLLYRINLNPLVFPQRPFTIDPFHSLFSHYHFCSGHTHSPPLCRTRTPWVLHPVLDP